MTGQLFNCFANQRQSLSVSVCSEEAVPNLISSSDRILIEPVMTSVDWWFKDGVNESREVVGFASNQLLGRDLGVDDEAARGGQFGVGVDFAAKAQTKFRHGRSLQTT